MNRRAALCLIAAIPAVPALAEVTALTATEIIALLSDRKISGDWNGTRYTQSFAATGHTVYIPEGGRPEAGRWRVNTDTDAYESFWERSGWSSYRVVREAGGLYWVDATGARQPFDLVPD